MSVVHRTIRSIQTASDCPRLTKFCLKPPKSVSIFSSTQAFFLFVYFNQLPLLTVLPENFRMLVTESWIIYAMLNLPNTRTPTNNLVNFQVEVEFENGSIFTLPAEYLRIYSPAADSKIRSVGGEKVIYGRRHVGIMSAEPVGNYGVRLLFDDLHKTGIFTWDYLYHLGSNKFTMMRNYIKTLHKHGLSRDPQRSKS